MSAQTVTKQLTRKSLAEAITSVERSINAWNAGEGPRVDWRGRNVKCLSERMIAVFGSLAEMTATNNVSQDAKKVVLAIDDFDDAMGNWAENCQINPDETNPAGDEEFWKAWKIVKLRIAERARAVPRHIKEYQEQSLNDRQIALQYHWVDKLGEPNIDMVQDEKLKPGTHFDPKTWVHPLDAKDSAEIDRAWSSRSVKVAAEQESKGVIPEAPESIYELLKQRVSSSQILRMKPKSTIEGIRAVALKHDLEVDGVKVHGEKSMQRTSRKVVLAMNSRTTLAQRRASCLLHSTKAMNRSERSCSPRFANYKRVARIPKRSSKQ